MSVDRRLSPVHWISETYTIQRDYTHRDTNLMPALYDITVKLFYQLSNFFFWPVAISLIVLFVWSLIELGRLAYNVFQRRGDEATNLEALGSALEADFRRNRFSDGKLNGVKLSIGLLGFWQRLEKRRGTLETAKNFEMLLDQALREEESQTTARLDFSRALVRLGPMLGLAGTIIPLGPALQSLLTGDMGGMVNHLVVGFGAVVCGLVMSGIAYAITLVRERWARADVEAMENLCELMMQARSDNAGIPA